MPQLIANTQPRPFLKWVGGKKRLVPDIAPMIPDFPGRYYEPFIGGGSLFFRLSRTNALISDINPELINAYKVVRDDVELLITSLVDHVSESDYYYSIRNWDRLPDFSSIDSIARASRFIYLNKTCFNGLFRENKSGQMNTPFGKYKNPTICDPNNLRAVSRSLQSVDIRQMSFSQLTHIDAPPSEGDFVYFDPPYVPVDSNSFTSYNKNGFDMDDQLALANVCKSLDAAGVRFLLSNSSAPILREIYKDFDIRTIQAPRSVNSNGKGRGKVAEILVKNY